MVSAFKGGDATVRVERRTKRKSRAVQGPAEKMWQDRNREHAIKCGDTLLALEAKLAAIKPRTEAVC